jgi:hypothetical protein
MRSLIFLFTNLGVIKSRTMGWLGLVARIGEMRNGYNILVLKAERKRRLERFRRR